MQYLCAPMEGVTGDLFRQAQRQTFPAADSYYTPFLSPTANRTFSPRELREIEPAHNAGIHVVPQLMGHCAEDFLWMAGRLADMGYDEVNFNLGCPSNTVTAKKKGAGLLTEPDLLRRFFDAVFAACPLPVSVKTRLGKATAETFPALLELYNDYPICELIVHPRVQADQYHGHPDLDMFAYALAHSRAPVCYNGDLFDAPAVRAFQARFPTVERVMLGRGLNDDEMSYAPSEHCNEKTAAILEYLNTHLTEDVSIDALADTFYLSKYYMMRMFRAETGFTIHGYLTDKRLRVARDLIAQGMRTTDACFQCGYHDYSAFSRAYKKRFQVSPREDLTKGAQ